MVWIRFKDSNLISVSATGNAGNSTGSSTSNTGIVGGGGTEDPFLHRIINTSGTTHFSWKHKAYMLIQYTCLLAQGDHHSRLHSSFFADLSMSYLIV